MRTKMTVICFVIMVILTGCSAPTTNSGSGKAPAATDTPVVSSESSKVTPEPSPVVTPEASEVTPKPSPMLTPSMEPEMTENLIDNFSDEDQAIIESKFTFSADPQTDKKIISGDVNDGTYVVKEPPTQYGHVPYVGLTIKDGQVVEVIFFQYNPETKSYKDENYGKEYGTQFGEDTFEKAQISVEGSKQYPIELIEKQDIAEVDAISGATYNYDLFMAGVNDALNQAKK